MKLFWTRFLLFVSSIIISSLINNLFIDSLLNIFAIMSNFALVANRVALALFIYFFVDMVFITRKFHFTTIINKLFFIYFIWLIGLLFGRFSKSSDYNIDKHFNFVSYLPKWINYLNHPLVRYYIFGNILVFIPLGLFLRYHRNLFFSLCYFMLIILLFETIQGVTNLGYFDIDDILLNGIGGLFGIVFMHIYKLLNVAKD